MTEGPEQAARDVLAELEERLATHDLERMTDFFTDDVVLIAGKGHETYQERNGVRAPFSDAEHAARALYAWGGAEA